MSVPICILRVRDATFIWWFKRWRWYFVLCAGFSESFVRVFVAHEGGSGLQEKALLI
jgi:hypothetical protein